MSFTSLSLLSAGLFALPALAMTSGEYAISLIEENKLKAWDNYNASTTVRLPGPNITSTSYGEPDEPVDWTLRLSVHADIPIPGDSDSRLFTGTQILWSAPEDVRYISPNATRGQRVNRSYGFCMGVPMAVYVHSSSEEVNSNCEGLVSDECLEALRGTVRSDGTCAGFTFMPEACSDDMDEDVDVAVATFGPIWDLEDRSLYYRKDDGAGSAYERGDHSPYDEAIRRAYVVYTAFVELEEDYDDSVSFNMNTKDGSRIFGQVSCLRVDNFEDGSRDLEDAAPSLKTLATWPIAGALMAVLFTML